MNGKRAKLFRRVLGPHARMGRRHLYKGAPHKEKAAIGRALMRHLKEGNTHDGSRANAAPLR